MPLSIALPSRIPDPFSILYNYVVVDCVAFVIVTSPFVSDSSTLAAVFVKCSKISSLKIFATSALIMASRNSRCFNKVKICKEVGYLPLAIHILIGVT